MSVSDLLNPVLLWYVDEFRQVLEKLNKAVRKELDFDDTELAKLARRLCVLSREIRVKLGPPKDAPDDVVNQIVKLFRDAAKVIQAVLKLVCDEQIKNEIAPYGTNIAQRADKIERGE